MKEGARLVDRIKDQIRARHYSYRTEQQYVYWAKRFIRFHNLRHPREIGGDGISAFLTDLAVSHKVAPSTQNQALSAILFLYKHVLGLELPWIDNVVRAKRQSRLPVVLSQAQVRTLLLQIDGPIGMMTRLMYGSGLRLMETLRLRVKDVDFEYSQIIVRDGKGKKDRVTVLPDSLNARLQAHLRLIREPHAVRAAAGAREYSSPSDPRRCATVSRPTCSSAATTYALCRS